MEEPLPFNNGQSQNNMLQNLGSNFAVFALNTSLELIAVLNGLK